jgi:hypothetical protein
MQRPSVWLLSRRTGGAAVLALAVATAACFLDRSVLPLGPAPYEAYAVVRNAAGVEVAVTETDDLFAAEMFALAVDMDVHPGAEERAALARSRFSRAVARRLAAGGDAVLAARFGPGPWCFVMEPIVWGASTRSTSTTPPDETGAELPMCVGPPPPPECANDGEMPRLDVDPPGGTFGDLPLGTQSGWLDVTLTNTDAGFICLASMVVVGPDAPDFQVDDTDCRPASPAEARMFLGDPRQTCTLHVRFAPGRSGPKSASLRISSSDPESPLRLLPLSGRSVPGTLGPVTPVCIPRAADGCFRRTVTFTNYGPGRVDFIGHGIHITTPNWSRPSCTFEEDPIPPGGTMACAFETCTTEEPGLWGFTSESGATDASYGHTRISLVPQVTPDTCTP